MRVNEIGNMHNSYVRVNGNELGQVGARTPKASDAVNLESQMALAEAKLNEYNGLNETSEHIGESDDDRDIYSMVSTYQSHKSKILSSNFIQNYLIPSSSSMPWSDSGNGLLDILFNNSGADSELVSILQSAIELKVNQAEFEDSLQHGRLSSEDYSGYLCKGDDDIGKLANDIIAKAGARTDDDKAYALMDWVQDNMKYRTDMKNHGVDELWSNPRQTLASGDSSNIAGYGDCEDGAFLIMSLMLNAGIEADNVRFYGGLVKAGTGAATGGHGWVEYKRSDDEWVTLDWCYLPNKLDIDDRPATRDDNNYVSSWFVINGDGLTIDTGTINAVNDPDAINKWDNYINSSRESLAMNSDAVMKYEMYKASAGKYLELMGNNREAIRLVEGILDYATERDGDLSVIQKVLRAGENDAKAKSASDAINVIRGTQAYGIK
ncbi:transglutaminase domain-containing protein [Methanococcoides sp. SA1]|nr:transglutaminase domain-containing protein [Methanococcoides sp. SA1]